jgi:sugar O-acyltransferase (sialic acid O-acetyltransferase NeuD family)
VSSVVIFGAGKYAEVAHAYFTSDTPHEVVAFTVDRAHRSETEKCGLPVVAFEDLEGRYPPRRVKMFVAIGYQDLNRLRARKYEACKAKGYELVSYVSSRASIVGRVDLGDNCLVLEHAVIQPGSRIGNDAFIWSGNLIGHHATVGDHTYVAGGVVVSGHTTVEPYCFLGVHATIGHEVTIGRESFVGAGSLVTRDVAAKSVYVVPDTPKYRLDSASFLQITKMR